MKEYLGDAVYAEVDRWGGIVLTTENGYSTSNTIVMEPQVITAMEAFIKQAREKGVLR